MATQLKLDSATESMIDDLMANGRFASREDVVAEGIRLVHQNDWIDEEVDLDSLDPETRAALEEAIAEADADPDGGIPAEEVFAELRQRYQNWT